MRVTLPELENSPMQVHVFYTGFTWQEIKEIWTAIDQSKKAHANDPYFDYLDYPSYDGLPKKISRRFTAEQVDLVNELEPSSVKELANVLARGR